MLHINPDRGTPRTEMYMNMCQRSVLRFTVQTWVHQVDCCRVWIQASVYHATEQVICSITNHTSTCDSLTLLTANPVFWMNYWPSEAAMNIQAAPYHMSKEHMIAQQTTMIIFKHLATLGHSLKVVPAQRVNRLFSRLVSKHRNSKQSPRLTQ